MRNNTTFQELVNDTSHNTRDQLISPQIETYYYHFWRLRRTFYYISLRLKFTAILIEFRTGPNNGAIMVVYVYKMLAPFINQYRQLSSVYPIKQNIN